MSYNIIPTDKFKKEAKRLKKKYASLNEELQELNESLREDPRQGTPLGNDTYKIRLSTKSKGKGKSGGARVITYVIDKEGDVYLLTIYDKADIEAVDDKTIISIIHTIKGH